jgi:hypothetical protein
MTGADARGEPWPDSVEDKQWIVTPRVSASDPQCPPYWTLDTTTDEWVQRHRDGTEIRRAPTRRGHQEA